MNIAIYQIDPDRDENNVAFLNYENLERFQGSAALRSEIYDKVFEGEVECGTLEEVYQMFNIGQPDGYRGRSLSVSDVVEVVGEEKSTFHFCDSIGFRKVDFDPDMTEPLKEKKIKVVLCEPGKVARVAEIGTELSDLQRVVGGLIEPFYPFEEQVCIFIKEDEKSLTFGDDRIREAVEKYNAKLLILDPMSSYIGGDCSMNNANETRAEFNHLIAVAKDTGCAIVIIAHMNKAKDTSPLYRTNGSIDIAGAARSILAVTRTANKQNPAKRYLVQVKSNLAPMGSAILFEVADKGVNFLDELELSAEDAFSASAPRMGRPNAREEAATDFIRSLLAGGRRLASDCEAKLEAAGFKKSTYKKSKKKAGVRSVKDGFFWYWTLPEVEKPIENGQEVTGEDDLPI